MSLLYFVFTICVANAHDIPGFEHWKQDIASKSLNSIIGKIEPLKSKTVHSICVSDHHTYLGLDDGQLAVLFGNQSITYHKITEFSAMNLSNIVSMTGHNMLLVSAYSSSTHRHRFAIIQLSTITTLLSITLAPHINTIAPCYSSVKSELIVVLGASNIIISVLIDRATHKLTSSTVTLNYRFESDALLCTAFDEGYVIQLDNECDKLLYIAETYQIIRSVAAYPIQQVQYEKIRRNHSVHNVNYMQQLPFQGDVSPLILTAYCVIQLDISMLYSIDAFIFDTDSLSLIPMHDIQPFTMHQTNKQLGYTFVHNDTIYSVLADVHVESSTESIATTPFSNTSYNMSCAAVRIKQGIKCYMNAHGYHVQSTLGSGSHALVWLASQHDPEGTFIQNVALKIFTNWSPFEQELCGMQRVHLYSESIPHLVSLIDYTDKIIVLQYIAGGDLASMMKAPNGVFLSMNMIDIVIQLLWQVSYPLSVMNDKMYTIHSDLKPDNILVSQYLNHTLEVKLSDLSCVFDVDELRSGSMGGSLFWMAPEMAESIYVSTPYSNNASLMCVDAYGLCLTAVHLYHSICIHRDDTMDDDILCDVAAIFQDTMDEFMLTEKNFFTAAKALNKMIRIRSETMQFALHKMADIDGSTKKMMQVLRLLSVFLQRTPYNYVKFVSIYNKHTIHMHYLGSMERFLAQIYFVMSNFV
eukprot:580126_1